jgi:hypothetical protein
MTNDMSRGGKGPQGGATPGQGKDQVQQKAAEVKDQVQQKAGELAAKAQEQVGSRIEGHKETAAQGISGVAQALRQTSKQLQGNDQMGLTNYIDQAADQVERLSGYLQNNDLGGLVRDLEGVARRQPAVFLGGMFLAGLIGARFLRSSRPASEYDARFRSYGYDAPDYGYRGVYGSGMGGAYSPGYTNSAGYTAGAGYAGATGSVNYGTGEIPGVYRESAEQRRDEARSRSVGEPMEE